MSTRSTLVNIGTTNISPVLESLITLLEDLGRGHKNVTSHPTHVVLSELYVLSLAADCCAAHWDRIATKGQNSATETQSRRASPDSTPAPLGDELVARSFDVLKHLLEPVSEGYLLPAHTILASTHSRPMLSGRTTTPSTLVEPVVPSHDDPRKHPALIEAHAKVLVEFLTASSWERSFEYFKGSIHNVRTSQSAQHGAGQPTAISEEDRLALVGLRLLSYFYVDGRKLGLIVQEICSSFLHFRRPFQNTIAAVLPVLITSWLNHYPSEFVQYHTQHRRLDGGADTLFDMAHALGDNGRRRGGLLALQTTLLFLLPDVFEVASNLRDAKSNSIVKKTTFLEGLRKALRNSNEQATYCLVSLLHACRHFGTQDDVAFVSFALDIQDEVTDAIFRRSPPQADAAALDEDLLTAAFVSLAQLNPSSPPEHLLKACLGTSAPKSFTSAMIHGCGYLARQPDARRYDALFSIAAPFMLGQLQVRWRSCLLALNRD